MPNESNELKYREEHLSCDNYLSGERAIWGTLKLGKGKSTFREGVERPTLIFVLSGTLRVSFAGVINREVSAGHLFLVPNGDNFYGSAVTDCLLMRCSFTREVTLCNRYSIEQLRAYIKPEQMPASGQIVLLPICDLLMRELSVTCDTLSTGLACIHYQDMKKDILFIELRGLYSRKDLAALFAPILGSDSDFKNRVMQFYPQVETAKELMELLHMSPSAFKRKFYEAFGTSAKQWMIQKKKEKLLRDIVMTNLSITELAEKYKLTANYLTTFCKEHFGKSPTELRTEGRMP